ncbi:MAG: hypothetical protein IJO45_07055 [Oscillospiraceae bacterium]|nr:hypothetical protein [Oscillospiraceae bacterium]
MKKTITLTHEQANDLVCYILMTTNYRKGEREAWESLAREKMSDGTLKFPNAPGNAQFWQEMDTKLDEIRNIIDNATLK